MTPQLPSSQVSKYLTLGINLDSSNSIGQVIFRTGIGEDLEIALATKVLNTQISSKYLKLDHSKIGTAKDIELITKEVITHYTNEGYFIILANQTVKKGKLMTDLVAYDYLHDSPISVEIESSMEVDSHPEHVKLNMTKWRDLGFSECHIWSKNAKIQEIYDSLSDEDKKAVKVFLV